MPRWQPYQPITTKDCKDCGLILHVSNFRHKVYKNGNIHYESNCKGCQKIYFSNLWRTRLKEKEVYIPDLEGEVWKDIKGFEGLYKVSNMGRIKSLEKMVSHKGRKPQHMNGRLLKQVRSGEYRRVTLVKKGVHYYKLAHILVAASFIPNPLRLPEVNHKFGIKDDNRASELEWSTHQDNCIHRSRVLMRNLGRGEKNKYSKKVEVHSPIGDVFVITGAQEAARRLGIDKSGVFRVLWGKTNLYKGYYFKYVA